MYTIKNLVYSLFVIKIVQVIKDLAPGDFQKGDIQNIQLEDSKSY